MGQACSTYKTNVCKSLGKKHDETACAVSANRENRGQL